MGAGKQYAVFFPCLQRCHLFCARHLQINGVLQYGNAPVGFRKSCGHLNIGFCLFCSCGFFGVLSPLAIDQRVSFIRRCGAGERAYVRAQVVNFYLLPVGVVPRTADVVDDLPRALVGVVGRQCADAGWGRLGVAGVRWYQ